MKMPEKVKTYCPKCKKHTLHEIERVRTGKRGELKWGQRRFRRALAGYGGFPRALPDRNKPWATMRLPALAVEGRHSYPPSLIQECRRIAQQSPAEQ
jgi:ribosomal protein L44E